VGPLFPSQPDECVCQVKPTNTSQRARSAHPLHSPLDRIPQAAAQHPREEIDATCGVRRAFSGQAKERKGRHLLSPLHQTRECHGVVPVTNRATIGRSAKVSLGLFFLVTTASLQPKGEGLFRRCGLRADAWSGCGKPSGVERKRRSGQALGKPIRGQGVRVGGSVRRG
jgi:hypothetical protein